MPVTRCSNGKFRVGRGPCNIKTRAAANRANRAVQAKKRGRKKR